jgi:hypothetical protein
LFDHVKTVADVVAFLEYQPKLSNHPVVPTPPIERRGSLGSSAS